MTMETYYVTAYETFVRDYEDWHYFLESVNLRGRKEKIICSFFGS